MKNTLIYFSAILLFLSTAEGCKKNKVIAKADDSKIDTASQTAEQPMNKLPLRKINTDQVYTWPGMVDLFTIEQLIVKGDTLFVMVNYGGGCEQHDFTMNTNMMWLKSNPPQLNLFMEHNAHGDKCRAVIKETLAFDITPIKYKEKGAVRLIINENREGAVLYQY